MGQFKPMVKMMTTEPSVELKLKKGGHVSMKKGGKSEHGHKKMADGGGAMGALAGTPALIGRPAVNAPVRAPGKPPMAARRKAMAPRAPIGNPSMPSTPMKKGGKAEGGKEDIAQDKAMIKKAFKQHDAQEHKGDKGTKLSLKKGGKMATGGVANGQGGYAKGGIINTEGQGGIYRNTKMDTAKPDRSPAKTGGVKDGNGGGYATGGVAKSNGGGYKAGGKAKKAYATGGKVDSGRPVAMPQGRKSPPTPVSINRLAGTYKSGGKVTPAEGRLRANYAAENATAMKQAKAQSNEVYSKYGKMKMADGGQVFSPEDIQRITRGTGAVTESEREAFQRFLDERSGKPQDLSNGAYDRHYANEKAENEAMREAILGAPKRAFDSIRGMFGGMGGVTNKEKEVFNKSQPKSVTQTEKSVTVTPAGKKRGGRC